MNRLIVGKIALGGLLAAVFGVASAAEPVVGKLARVNGTAVVSQGAGYVMGREGMGLRAGDRLMALEGGSAVIQFQDGCQYTLSDSEVFSVGAESTCAAPAAPQAVAETTMEPYTAVSQQTPTEVASSFKQAAIGGTAAADLSWVPLAAVGVVGVAGAAADTGTDDPVFITRMSP